MNEKLSQKAQDKMVRAVFKQTDDKIERLNKASNDKIQNLSKEQSNLDLEIQRFGDELTKTNR